MIALRQIVVEPVMEPAGAFLVIVSDRDGAELVSNLWENREIALTAADHLKRDFAPAIILDWTGGAHG